MSEPIRLDQLKGNSKKSREQIADQKQIEKVVTGKVTIKKKSAIKKAFCSFVGEDIVDIKAWFFHDVLLPSAREMMLDLVENMTGASIRKKNSSLKKTSKISYEKMYNSGSKNKRRRDRRGVYEIDDIFVDSKAEAEEVIDYICDLIEEYGSASVGDLFGCLGEPSSHVDEKYGWTTFRDARSRRTGNGDYLLLIPMAYPID